MPPRGRYLHTHRNHSTTPRASRGHRCHLDSTNGISLWCSLFFYSRRNFRYRGTWVRADALRGDAGAQGGRSCFRPRPWSELSCSAVAKMETILEQQRRYHEEKERLMDVMAKEMLTKKSTVSGAWAGPPSAAGPHHRV